MNRLRAQLASLAVAIALTTGCAREDVHPAKAFDTGSVPPKPLLCDSRTPGGRLAPADGVWFGANLDWSRDSLAAYARRTGRSPAVVTQFIDLPVTPEGSRYVDQLIEQLRPTGGMLLLTLEPKAGLDAVTDAVIDDVADRLARYNAEGVPVLLRFAHEMNGSWYPWSQQPEAYVSTFRRVAAAVHARAPGSAMLWAPNYGGGYPFTGGRYMAAPGSADAKKLDTDGDGRLDSGDDPYAPYYPGDDAVDWVGMSLYHWGSTHPWGQNQLPEPGKFDAMLTGTYRGSVGDERGVPDFYAAYGQGRGKPVGVFETAAFYAPGSGGADALAIKSAWWSQVYSEGTHRRFPRLQMINWFEWDKHEVEVGKRVDWGVTVDPAVRERFRAAIPSWARFADSVRFCRAG